MTTKIDITDLLTGEIETLAEEYGEGVISSQAGKVFWIITEPDSGICKCCEKVFSKDGWDFDLCPRCENESSEILTEMENDES